MNNIKNFILEHDITLIITPPKLKITTIINLLNEISIKDQYRTTLFSTNIRSEYYSKKLITFLSGINSNLITKYHYPYIIQSKNNKEKIDRDKYINAIEKIQKSNILMTCKNNTKNDCLEHILNYRQADIIIIDNLYTLLDKTKYSVEGVVKKIKTKKNTHFVVFINTKDHEKIIKKYNKCIKNIILVNEESHLNRKNLSIRIVCSKTI